MEGLKHLLVDKLAAFLGNDIECLLLQLPCGRWIVHLSCTLSLPLCTQDAIQGTIIAGNDTTSTGMISLLGMWPQLPQQVKDKVWSPMTACHASLRQLMLTEASGLSGTYCLKCC